MTDAYDPATRPCSHGPTPGCTSLQHAILGYWPQATNLGTFICRPTADGAPSVHGNGRAGDIGPGLEPCAAIAEWLVTNHTVLGVQLVIWNHHIWNVNRADEGWRPYGCDKPGSQKDHHTGHLHYEINVDAGKRLTPGIIDAVLPYQPPQPEPPQPEDDMPYMVQNEDNELWFVIDGNTRRRVSSNADTGPDRRLETVQELRNKGVRDAGKVSTGYLTDATIPVSDED